MIEEPISDADLVLYVLDRLNLGFVTLLLESDIIDIDELYNLLLFHD